MISGSSLRELEKVPLLGNNSEEAAAAKKMLVKVEESAHPGFAVIFDNIDLEIKTKNMTMSNQKTSHHWVNHKMVINRVSGMNTLKKSPPDLQDVPNQSFMPTIPEMQSQRLDYIVSRMLVEYFAALSPFKDVVTQHIPHKYSKEMSKKSTKVNNSINYIACIIGLMCHWASKRMTMITSIYMLNV